MERPNGDFEVDDPGVGLQSVCGFIEDGILQVLVR